MPDMTGGVLYPLIKSLRPGLKAIVNSGFSLDGPARDVMKAGAEGFIQKPFTKADLTQKIAEILESKQGSVGRSGRLAWTGPPVDRPLAALCVSMGQRGQAERQLP